VNGYALAMLIGLWVLRPGFTGVRDRWWWTIALGIQSFHHREHLLLQIKAILGYNFWGQPVPTSLVQLWVPRVELHLFYNTIVFVPMGSRLTWHVDFVFARWHPMGWIAGSFSKAFGLVLQAAVHELGRQMRR
jgi:hypothetical protein